MRVWSMVAWVLCHCQVLRPIVIGCINVCLEKKEGRFRGEAGTECLHSGGNQGEGVGTVKPVLLGGLLWLSGNSLVGFVWKSVGDGLTDKVESDMWVARAATWRQGSLHVSRMGCLPWLLSCRLLTVKPWSVRRGSYQPTYIDTCYFINIILMHVINAILVHVILSLYLIDN